MSEEETKKKRIKAGEFALVWNKAKGPNEVAEHFEIDEARAKQKASMFRRRGVTLKKFAREHPGNTVDWEAINAEAKKVLEEQGIDPNEVVTPVAPKTPREKKATMKKAGTKKKKGGRS